METGEITVLLKDQKRVAFPIVYGPVWSVLI